MICSWFKGGTGSASRIFPGRKTVDGKLVECENTVAALVQANYGRKNDFRVGGLNVGRYIVEDDEAEDLRLKASKENKDGSIIIIIATDVPLSPSQLQRVAKRGTVGLARVGGMGHNTR